MTTTIRSESANADRLRRVAKRLALAVDSVAPTPRGLVVLAYHRVGGRTNSAVDLPADLFRRQMAHLAARADVISLDEGVNNLPSAQSAASGLVLTFDDGTADFRDEVLPVLIEYQLRATIYIATSFIDDGRNFPGDGVPLSWNALREVVSTGLVTVGAHTHNHVLLDRCLDSEVDDELKRCDDRIADELGTCPDHFAYPKAVRGNAYAESAVRSRYRSAAVAGTRPNQAGTCDLWRLNRSPIQNTDGWDGFSQKCEGGMRVEDDFRRLLNLVRYRGLDE